MVSCKVKHPHYQLALSAKTEEALHKKMEGLKHFVLSHPDIPIEDIIYSVNLLHNDKEGPVRLSCYIQSHAELISVLQQYHYPTLCKTTETPSLGILFTGQGRHYKGMTQQLYATEKTFKSTIDRCADIINPLHQNSLHDFLFDFDLADNKTSAHLIHSALFSIELGLAHMLKHYGVKAQAMIGQSIGRYVVEVLKESLSLEEALHLLCCEQRSIDALDEDEIASWLNDEQIDVFLEIGPHPALAPAKHTHFHDHKGLWLTIVEPKRTQWEPLLATLAELYLEGVDVNWAAFARANGNKCHPVPLLW